MAKFGSLQGSTAASLQKFGEFLKLRVVLISHHFLTDLLLMQTKLGLVRSGPKAKRMTKKDFHRKTCKSRDTSNVKCLFPKGSVPLWWKQANDQKKEICIFALKKGKVTLPNKLLSGANGLSYNKYS